MQKLRYVVAILAAFPLLMSGSTKLLGTEQAIKMLEAVGFDGSKAFVLGLLEVSIPILYLIPRTAFLGAALSTGFMGAAVALHFRIGEAFIFQLIIGALFWLGLYLRDERLKKVLIGA